MPSTRISIEGIFPTKYDALPDRQAKRLLRDIERYMKGDLGSKLEKAYGETVENWKGKPTFASNFAKLYGGATWRTHVGPTGANTTKWQRVSGGTGPRSIVSSKGPMTFQVGYTPKTKPGGRYGGPGTRYGSTVRANVVGLGKPHRIAPRKFSEQIKQDKEKEIQQDFQEILRKIR